VLSPAVQVSLGCGHIESSTERTNWTIQGVPLASMISGLKSASVILGSLADGFDLALEIHFICSSFLRSRAAISSSLKSSDG
jgi:hypothetical protein